MHPWGKPCEPWYWVRLVYRIVEHGARGGKLTWLGYLFHPRHQNDRLYGQRRFAPSSAALQRIIICYDWYDLDVSLLDSIVRRITRESDVLERQRTEHRLSSVPLRPPGSRFGVQGLRMADKGLEGGIGMGKGH